MGHSCRNLNLKLGQFYSGLIKKEDGYLDLNQPAETLEKKIRAFNPWPICYLNWDSSIIRIFSAEVSSEKNLKKFARGVFKNFPVVGTLTYDLILLEVQPSGKNKIDGKSFLNGARNWLNEENIKFNKS